MRTYELMAIISSLEAFFLLISKEIKLRGALEFVVSEETISEATSVPLQGKSWFKGNELDAMNFKEYLKP